MTGTATPTDPLVAFLRARLDEEAMEVRGYSRRYAGGGPGILVVKHTWPQEAVHIVRHDPARVLRDVEADRKLIRLHSPEPGQHPDFCGHDMHKLPCPTLCIRAERFSGHPDYRPEWKP